MSIQTAQTVLTYAIDAIAVGSVAYFAGEFIRFTSRKLAAKAPSTVAAVPVATPAAQPQIDEVAPVAVAEEAAEGVIEETPATLEILNQHIAEVEAIIEKYEDLRQESQDVIAEAEALISVAPATESATTEAVITVTQLRKLARIQGVARYSRMSKAQLLEVVQLN